MMGAASLQWGRGLLAAEMTASTTLALMRTSLLQWGRGLLAAEITVDGLVDRSTTSFNGAAAC